LNTRPRQPPDVNAVNALYERLLALTDDELATFAKGTAGGRGWTTVRRASFYQETFPIFRLLIERGGADPEQTDYTDHKWTLLTTLLLIANANTVLQGTRFLVEERRVNLEAIETASSRTVLHFAIQELIEIDEAVRAEVLEILLQNGADTMINAKDSHETTPLMGAIQEIERFHLVPMLLRYGAEIHHQDLYVRTIVLFLFIILNLFIHHLTHTITLYALTAIVCVL